VATPPNLARTRREATHSLQIACFDVSQDVLTPSLPVILKNTHRPNVRHFGVIIILQHNILSRLTNWCSNL